MTFARRLTGAGAALVIALVSGNSARAAPSAAIRASIADPARPAADVARDRDRKPAEMLAFAAVRPGMIVADLMSGPGYFTRLFAKAVGPTGKVYALTEAPRPGHPDYHIGTRKLAKEPGYGNVIVDASPDLTFKLPEKLDLVWTSQNYHDLYLGKGDFDVAGLDRRIFDALRPGGMFIVLDHRAKPGAPIVATANALHRIDPAVVRRQVEAAGFVYVGESRVVANPADPDTKNIYDPAFNGRTDQFVLKFRKPA